MARDTVGGFALPGFESVEREFRENLAVRGDRGSAFSATVDGEVVVDLWGGWHDRPGGSTWRRDTAAAIFSGTKGLVATCMLMLIERGLMDLTTPVTEIWPEFGAHGKGDILVRHVLAHRAGLPGLSTPVSVSEATDAARMAALIAAQRPLGPAGTQFNYHALTFGWMCAEIVRRVDGRTVGRFFDEEIARPLALEIWIGLPTGLHERVAHLEPIESEFADPESPIVAGGADSINWSIWQNPPRHSIDPLPGNTVEWRENEIPGAGGIATARAMARFYECLVAGGELDRIRILESGTLRLARQQMTRGIEPTLGKEMVFGAGFELQSRLELFGPPTEAFGHSGAGGSVHGAWPAEGTSFSFVTRSLRDSLRPDPRATALLSALYSAIA